MSVRNVYLALSMLSNLALLIATIVAFATYTLDSGLIIGAFFLNALATSNAILSLHFRNDDESKR